MVVHKALTMKNVSERLKEMDYAVRGLIPSTADQISAEIASGKHPHPFEQVVQMNIGNPHIVGQQPISYYRDVLALVNCPTLLEAPQASEIFTADVISRAKELANQISGGTGAYSHSQGVPYIRQHVAEFIAKRDGHPSNPNDIFLANGASSAIGLVMQAIIGKPTDGVMIPIPQYPIYTAYLALLGGMGVGYYADESQGWGLDVAELERAISEARANGCDPRAFVLINPGNPTGNVLSYENLVEVVRFCRREGLVLISDEVYQENVYTEGKKFISAHKVVRDLGHEYDGFELVSLHSVSKGIIGECGRRGGYMELCGFCPQVQAEIYKLASSGLCPNMDGQIMVDLMVKPPTPDMASYPRFKEQCDAIFTELQTKSKMVHAKLNSIPGVSCQPLDGAMYAFPSIELSAAAIKAAEAEGLAPDTFYALSLLRTTGICAVPGSGFRQREGTWHLRMTFLPAKDELEQALERFEEHHLDFTAKYA